MDLEIVLRVGLEVGSEFGLRMDLEIVLRVGLEVGSELEVAVEAKVLPARSKVADREIESHSVEARLG
jgi:hypothetical protein